MSHPKSPHTLDVSVDEVVVVSCIVVGLVVVVVVVVVVIATVVVVVVDGAVVAAMVARVAGSPTTLLSPHLAQTSYTWEIHGKVSVHLDMHFMQFQPSQ